MTHEDALLLIRMVDNLAKVLSITCLSLIVAIFIHAAITRR